MGKNRISLCLTDQSASESCCCDLLKLKTDPAVSMMPLQWTALGVLVSNNIMFTANSAFIILETHKAFMLSSH